MKNEKFFSGVIIALLLFLAAGCSKDKPTFVANESDLMGVWLKEGSGEYWSYRADHSGAKWDTVEGFSEEFPSYSYTWTLEQNQLRYTTLGDEINVPITRIYTITELDHDRMVREEEIGSYVLRRVAD